ncbi:MAG: BspA family leucine-rich repeat surface protein, partial [Balneolaceae bacterium]|nr:BspA family leucine-rich repeat surface protein [Balneolaceae bacterium]
MFKNFQAFLIQFFVLFFAIVVPLASAQTFDPFITTWKTDNPGDSDDQSIRIPMIGNGYDFNVDWGDGNDEDYNINPGDDVEHFLEHTYSSAGEYEVKITGDFPRIYINSEGDEDKILTIDQWGDIAWTSMHDAFRGASNLTYNATDAPDLSGVTDLSGAFRGTDMFNGDIGNWDVSTITDMSSMFAFTDAFNQDIGYNPGTGEGWDVSNVTNMNNMFQEAEVFNQDIGGWDVSGVNSMSDMFSEADAFNQDIGDWDVSKVETMEGMFFGADAFNQDIGYDPNTEEGWDVSSVTDMSGMFAFAGAFNQDISGWDVSSVTLMLATFFDAGSFNQDLGGWDISSVTTMESMLGNSGLSTENYDATLTGWAAQTVQSDVDLGADGLTYCDGADARGVLTGAPNNWTITGDELAEDCGEFAPFITTWKTDNPGVSDDQSIRIPVIGNGYDFNVDWGDGNDEDYINDPGVGVSHFIEHTYTTPGEYEVKISGTFPRIHFNNLGDREKILTIQQWGDIEWSSMNAAFAGASNVTYSATDEPDLSAVNSMAAMFNNARDFNGDLSSWDVSNINNMSSMFSNATSFNGNVSTWNVSNVTNMEAMFNSASAFNQDLSEWIVGNVENMGGMFNQVSTFDQDISGWNVESVTDMRFMFFEALAFNQDISDWDVSNVEQIRGMFSGAENFNQNISNWDVSGIEDMVDMFANASSFDQNLSGWDISSITTMAGMLDGSGLSTENYDATLTGWAAQTVESDVDLGADGLTYCDGADARGVLTGAPNNWTITGDELAETCGEFRPFITTWRTDNPGGSDDQSIRIPMIGNGYDFTVDWGDGSDPEEYSNDPGEDVEHFLEHTYASAGEYEVKITGEFPRIYINNNGDQEKLLTIDQWGDIAWSSMELAFFGASNLTYNATDQPDLSGVTSTRGMFYFAGLFNGDIGGWDVSSVTDMRNMFNGATAFNQDIGEWDVSSVINMGSMF